MTDLNVRSNLNNQTVRSNLNNKGAQNRQNMSSKTSSIGAGVSDEKKAESQGPKEIRLSITDAKRFFDADETELKQLRFTDVSLYSSTPTDQAVYTAELLLNYYTKEELKTKTLTDATACIGGNTWIFSDYVGKVVANDLSKIHAEILASNMKILRSDRDITVLNKNYLDIYLDIEQDIIFFDPPWGGVDYKKYHEVEISLQDSNKIPKKLDEIVLGLLQYRCETLLLKLPANYPIKKITDNCTFPNIDDLVIKADDGKQLYRLVVLSHLPRITNPVIKSFPRVGYKSIVPLSD